MNVSFLSTRPWSVGTELFKRYFSLSYFSFFHFVLLFGSKLG